METLGKDFSRFVPVALCSSALPCFVQLLLNNRYPLSPVLSFRGAPEHGRMLDHIGRMHKSLPNSLPYASQTGRGKEGNPVSK